MSKTPRVRPLQFRPPSPSTPPPTAGEPPHMDIEATLFEMHGMIANTQKENAEIKAVLSDLTPEGVKAGTSMFQATVEEYERKLKPMRKVWAVITSIGAVAVLIFGVGVSYQQFMGGNATKADIELHKETDLLPVIEDVKTIQNDLGPVKSGVASLVKTQEQEREVKRLKRQLERHDKEYQEALQEYTADKAAGNRSGPRPRKTEAHLALEAQVKEIEDQL